MNQNSVQPSSNMEVLNDILKAINGEYTAISCYEILVTQASNTEIKNRILEIRNDETFWHPYFSLTRKQASPQITKQCPTDYKSGILAAFIDEQNHAVWYLCFMTRPSLSNSRRSCRLFLLCDFANYDISSFTFNQIAI